MAHKVTKTEVVPVKGEYGVKFTFDDGYTDFAEVGDKATAEFYARVQLGQRIPMNVNPLLLSAEKAEALREGRGQDETLDAGSIGDDVRDGLSSSPGTGNVREQGGGKRRKGPRRRR